MNTQCVSCKPGEGGHVWPPRNQQMSGQPAGNSQCEIVGIGRLLVKGFSIAAIATIVLPVCILVLLKLFMGANVIMGSLHFFRQIGGDLVSVLLVLNFVLVFLGLLVPDILQTSKRH
ncbi:hypothetical protein P886_4137 [Alteromonadaceae bacterium 2753L.S.0a.02]|nr:hypothetical protein P886_4137 [Alteromonadaceae bacterium 2753L.S.0a.02]